MEAKIRKTGELISVICFRGDANREETDCVSYIDTKGNEHINEKLNYYWDLELINENTEKVIDWEQRRYELVKEAMNGILSNSLWDKVSSLGLYKSNVVGNAISYADEIIEKIKNDENKRNDIQSTK